MGQSVNLRELIAASFGPDAAEAWTKTTLNDTDKQKLVEAGRQVLDLMPGRMAHACALMSAAYSIALEKLDAPRGYVVAGSLCVGDTRVFGKDGELDWKRCFSRSNPSWDGHSWIVCGDWLADASVFRTADSTGSPPALSRYVEENFGRGRGLMAVKLAAFDGPDLRYVPQYVLTQGEVDALARGALKVASETSSP